MFQIAAMVQSTYWRNCLIRISTTALAVMSSASCWDTIRTKLALRLLPEEQLSIVASALLYLQESRTSRTNKKLVRIK